MMVHGTAVSDHNLQDTQIVRFSPDRLVKKQLSKNAKCVQKCSLSLYSLLRYILRYLDQVLQ